MKGSDEPLMGQSELAALFRVTPKTIQNWDRAGMRVARVGQGATYNAAEAVAWKLAQEKGGDPKSAAELRKLEAEARRVELQVAEQEGALIPKPLHLSRLRTIIERLRARLSSAPGAWAPQLVGLKTVPESLERIRSLVNELLTAMNAAADEIVPGDEDAGDRAA